VKFYAPEGPQDLARGFNPISANLIKASTGECILSQRDSMIVARHEVPGGMRKIAPSQRDD
jgi:hypothetical protein